MMRIPILLSVVGLIAVLTAGCNGSPDRSTAEVLRPQDQLAFDVLYKQNCAACHGTEGRNGAAMDLANPEYQALVDDRSLRNWIGGGMPGTQMPAFGLSAGGPLTERQIDVLVLGMRTKWSQQGALAGLSPPPYSQQVTGDSGRGLQGYNTYCASCHHAANQQVTSPDYLALVSDQALRSIVIAGRPDIGQPDWRNDKSGYSLSVQNVTDIVAYLASLRTAAPGQPYPQHP